MFGKMTLSALAATGALTLTQAASGAVIAEFNFDDGDTAVDNTPPANVTVGNITGSGGMSVGGGRFGHNDQPLTKSFSFDVTVAAGYQVDLTSFTFDMDVPDRGANNGSASIAGTTLTLNHPSFVDPLLVPGGSTTVLLDDANPNDVEAVGLPSALTGTFTVTVSFESWRVRDNNNDGDLLDGGDDYASRSFGDLYYDNIVLDGNVSLIPEPASLALLGLGGVMMLARRRRA